jgi:hypothetical protein
MRRISLTAFAMAIVAASSAGAQSTPRTITPEGAAQPLPRAGQATRVDRLGLAPLYTVAVYAEDAALRRVQLVSPDQAKALRIDIDYKDDLRRQIWVDWRRELVPPLSQAAMTQLRATFASLRQGDVVLVEYAPAKGTAIRVNDAVVVSEASHDLMLSFLDHWLGQRPVSEQMKQALLGGA